MERSNFSAEAKFIDELGGPGVSIGYGFSKEQAIQLALVAQLKRIADVAEAWAGGAFNYPHGAAHD